jgi:polysaccharide export outer membrane protein
MSALRKFWFAARGLALCAAALAGLAGPAIAALQPGDRVSIYVYDHPDITSTAVVTNDGTITVPLAGRVSAAGREPADLAHEVERRLRSYVVDPAVEIRLLERPFNVDYATIGGYGGGTIALKPGEHLIAAIGESRLTSSADLHRVTVERNGRSIGEYDIVALRGSGDPGPIIVAGDVIRVPSKGVAVIVDGAVLNAGTIFLDANEPLGDALQQAGEGRDANLTRIILDRAGQTTLVSLGSDVMLRPGQPGDHLTVPQSQLIQVIGYVGNPGVVALKTDRTLMSAIYLSGGPRSDGDLRGVTIFHRDGSRSDYDLKRLAGGDFTQNPDVADGDIVFVRQQRAPLFDARILFYFLLGLGARYLPPIHY